MRYLVSSAAAAVVVAFVVPSVVHVVMSFHGDAVARMAAVHGHGRCVQVMLVAGQSVLVELVEVVLSQRRRRIVLLLGLRSPSSVRQLEKEKRQFAFKLQGLSFPPSSSLSFPRGEF